MARHTLLLLGCCFLLGCGQAEPEGRERPNILLIIADDVGMAELGAFGGEIPTPHLDALAYGGIRLSAFHMASACSPTRAMLFSGVDSHLAGLGNMAEEMAPNQKGQPGYEGHMNLRVAALPALLRDAGYRTYFSGKWHLGDTPQTVPSARGFDRAFSLLSGGAHHYADMKPAYAPTPDAKAPFMEDGVWLTALPENYLYSSQFLVDKLIEYLDDGEETRRDAPFFAVLSFMAPHWPLQAPDGAVRRHRGKYGQGYEVVARERHARQMQLGIIPPGTPMTQMPPKGRPWRQLTPKQRRFEIRAMEIYAAMIAEMDHHTGRLLAHLRGIGKFDDTVVIFISDNGAEGHDLEETWPADLFPEIRAVIDASHDFSYENMGKPNSYTFYGPNWAWAGAPALRGHKGFFNEGGMRSPAFVYQQGRFAQGRVHPGQFHITDLAPTILEIAGIAHPGTSYRGRKVFPLRGRSMLPYLEAQEPTLPGVRLEIGELMGKRYVMRYPWKILHQPPPHGTGDWQLFHLQRDLAESTDLAAEHPELVRELVDEWDTYVADKGVILPDWVSGY